MCVVCGDLWKRATLLQLKCYLVFRPGSIVYCVHPYWHQVLFSQVDHIIWNQVWRTTEVCLIFLTWYQFNPLQLCVDFLYPLVRFSDVFRGYGKVTPGCNGIIYLWLMFPFYSPRKHQKTCSHFILPENKAECENATLQKTCTFLFKDIFQLERSSGSRN